MTNKTSFLILLWLSILISSLTELFAQKPAVESNSKGKAQEMPPPIEEVKNEPIKYIGGITSNKNYYDGRIPYAIGVHNYQAMRANRTKPPEVAGGIVGWTYNHQPYLAYWNDRYYLQYLSNPVSENVPPGRTVLMTSDDGIHWSPPRIVFPVYRLPKIKRNFEDIGNVDLPEGTSGAMHQRMGFYIAPNGRLLTLGFYSFSFPPVYPGVNNGQGLGRVVREVNKDGTFGPIYFIRYNRSAGWNEDNTLYPFYKNSDDKGFIEAADSLLADKLMTLQWREEEMPDEEFYNNNPDDRFKAFIWTTRPDGTSLGIMKDGISVLSPDKGKTWSAHGKNKSLMTASSKVWLERTKDDRYALVYNHSATRSNRFPMAVMTSNDAHTFDNLLNLNGEVPPMRYFGWEKNVGSQYFRGIVPGNGNPPGDFMWNTYSMNKEDMWVSRTPVPIVGTVEEHVNEDFQKKNISELTKWNLYVPQWAPISIVEDPYRLGNKVLQLKDEEPYDYALAQRAFPESKILSIEFKLNVKKVGSSYLYVEVQDKNGRRPVQLRFDDELMKMDRFSVEPDPLLFPTSTWAKVRMDLDCEKQEYILYLNGIKKDIIEFEDEESVESLERLVFRTGPWRGDVRQFILDGEPGTKGIYKEDLHGTDAKSAQSIFLIDDVITK